MHCSTFPSALGPLPTTPWPHPSHSPLQVDLLDLPSLAPSYHPLASPPSHPPLQVLYVHCSTGHGRTGTVCSLLLGLAYRLPGPHALHLFQVIAS